jgi:molecular chaperone GrpE
MSDDSDARRIDVTGDPTGEPATAVDGEPEDGAATGESEAGEDDACGGLSVYDEMVRTIEGLQQQLAQRDHKLHEYIEAHKRAVEEMSAARQRMERDREDELDRRRADLAREMLDVADDLDRTVASAATTDNARALREGMVLVHNRMKGKLAGFGVEPLRAVGLPFDPNLHEAVGMVPVADPAQDQVVLAEEQAGYLLHGRLLRAARVVVGTYNGS